MQQTWTSLNKSGTHTHTPPGNRQGFPLSLHLQTVCMGPLQNLQWDLPVCPHVRPSYAVLAYANIKPNKDQILHIHATVCTLVLNTHTQGVEIDGLGGDWVKQWWLRENINQDEKQIPLSSSSCMWAGRHPRVEHNAFFSLKWYCHIYECVGATECNMCDGGRGSNCLHLGIICIRVGSKHCRFLAYSIELLLLCGCFCCWWGFRIYRFLYYFVTSLYCY